MSDSLYRRKDDVQDAQPCVVCHEPAYLRLDGMPGHTTRQCLPGVLAALDARDEEAGDHGG
jgi:hypothetical protein